tara:strand:- start:148 stop:513 length:366 start_codon:yes stop_codon:yes gene_type:complete
MNWIKRIFCKKVKEKQCAIDSVSCSDANKEETQEDRLINKISELLKEKPDMFSAKWFNGRSIDRSVRSKDAQILIGLDGFIIAPIEPYMTNAQKKLLADLIIPIVERDKKELIDKAMSSYS